MKKLTKIFLSICAMIFAVSCADGLDANASQSGRNPADLIDDGKSSISSVTAFINHYAGVYYSPGLHYYKHDNSSDTGYKVDYKFRDGKIYTYNQHNEGTQLVVEPVEAVLESEKKMQLRRKDKGEVLVFNMTDTGLETYVSYILEKVSDDVLIQNPSIGYLEGEGLEQYKGTYNSMAQDNKIENYIAIDGEGNIYFHDANVTEENGRAGFTIGEGLTIIESYNNTMRKIIFKFDQGVYRRYAIDGPRENVDESYIGICEVTTDFIEDRFDDAIYQTEDFKYLEGLYEGTTDYTPTKAQGYSMRLNEPEDDGIGRVVAEGAICFTGTYNGYFAGIDNVMHITVLKGNTLHVMGRYNAQFVFSDDWQTATCNGQTLKLVMGSVKNVVPSTRKTSTFVPLKRR